MPITDYKASAASNTTLGTIPVGPNMERNKVNDAIQQLMADIAAIPGDGGSDLVGFLQAGTGAVARKAQAKMRDIVTPEDFGIVDDANYMSPGTAIDQATALQAWLNYCQANRLTPACHKPIRAYSSASLTYDPSALVGSQKIPDIRLGNLTVAFGTSCTTGFTFGSVTAVLDGINFEFPNVRRTTLSWSGTPNTKCGAIVIQNLRFSKSVLSDVRGFTVGFQHWSEGYGYTYNTFTGGAIQDCRFGEVICCVGVNSYANENTWLGGNSAYSSGSTGQTSTLVAGVYFTVGTSGYRGSNGNRWYGRCFELTNSSTHPSVTESVPVWFEGAGNYNRFHDVRVENWRGPLMHVRGDVNGDANALYGVFNEFDGQLILDNSGEGRRYVRQVCGAYGNLLSTQERKNCYKWRSGQLRELIYSGGGADAARTVAPFILREGTNATNYRQLSFSNRAATNIYGQQWNNGGCFVLIDTSRVKDFEFTAETLDGFPGRWFFAAYDANLTLLGATTTDSYGTERNIKFSGATSTSLYGGGYQQSADGVWQPRVTVRDEVKYLLAGPCSGSNAIVVSGFEITAFSPDQKADATASTVGPIIFDPLYIAQVRTASANPSTSGTHGFYSPGSVVGNTGATSGQPSGWVCTAGVALGVAFATSTAYSVPGQVVIANSNAYYVKTPGTTSSAGTGPIGTTPGTDYTDGSVVFRYIGAKAALSPLANVP